MKKIILIGRVAAGKTTLTQALRGEKIHYFKTQYVNYLDTIIDTPGEYTELRQTSGALALYSYEADVVGLVLSANEPYSIFSPCITSLVNREVIGIISGIANSFLSFFLAIILSIYMIIEKEHIFAFFRRFNERFLPERTKNIIYLYGRKTVDRFYSYFTGLALDALIVGVICSLFF